jgi:hypothetical protein
LLVEKQRCGALLCVSSGAAKRIYRKNKTLLFGNKSGYTVEDKGVLQYTEGFFVDKLVAGRRLLEYQKDKKRVFGI